MRLLFCLFLLAFRLIRINGNKNYDYYNQSAFYWKDNESPPADECAIQACYSKTGSSSGSGDSTFCDWERKCIESQYHMDLELYELEKLCPEQLLRVPDNVRDNNNLLYSDNCGICPRYECDNATNPLNLNYTYTEIYYLQFDTTPINYRCYQCECEQWWDADPDIYGTGDIYAWNCNKFNSLRYSLSDPNVFDMYTCAAPTDSPSPSPTMEPTPNTEPSSAPTQEPTKARCTDAFGFTHEYGEYFWDADVNNGCEEYCYCQVDGIAYCQTGWDAILSDDTNDLYAAFLSECRYYMTECYDRTDEDQVNRLFKYYDPALYCSAFNMQSNSLQCPRCACDTQYDTHASNTTFNTTTFDSFGYTTWNDTGSRFIYMDCDECYCERVINDNYLGNFSYINPSDCDTYDGYNNIVNPDDCIYEPFRCFDNYESWEYKAKAGYDSCSYDSFERHCSFSRATLNTYPEDICVEDTTEYAGSWGCDRDWYCLGFGGVGCYHTSFDYTVRKYDCMNSEWVKDNYNMDYTYSCCDDKWMCNNNTIAYYMDNDESECVDSEALETYIEFTSRCPYSRRNLYEITDNEDFIRAAFCGDTIDYDKYLGSSPVEDATTELCDLLQVYWNYTTYCTCNTYRILVSNINENEATIDSDDLSDMISIFQNSFDGSYSWMIPNLQLYSDYWGCFENTYSCDVTSEYVPISDSGTGGGKDSSNNIFNIYLIMFITIFTSLFTTSHSNLLIILISVFAIFQITLSSTNNMDWDLTGSGRIGECEVEGNVESEYEVCEYIQLESNQYQTETLEWSSLIKACPQLEYAGCWTQDKQIPLDDLVWDKTTCSECPMCPCSNSTDLQERYKFNIITSYDITQTDNDLITRTCYVCDCEFNDDYEDFVWQCGGWDSVNGGRAVNDTFYCPETSTPTASPVEPIEPMECVYGYDYDNLDDSNWYYYPSYTHCMYRNTTVIGMSENPKVCVNEDVDGYHSEYWGVDRGVIPICESLGGNGCYYNEYDITVKQYDCALDKYISDTYTLQSTYFCCNDGIDCNNQSLVYGANQPAFTYYSIYNETVTVECEESDTLRQYYKQHFECIYGEYDGINDDSIEKSILCGNEYRGPKSDNFNEMCDKLDDIWYFNTKCDCEEALWFINNNNVDDIFDTIIDSSFKYGGGPYPGYQDLAEDLYKWNNSLNCKFPPETHWYCNKSIKNNLNINIVITLITAASYLFYLK